MFMKIYKNLENNIETLKVILPKFSFKPIIPRTSNVGEITEKPKTKEKKSIT